MKKAIIASLAVMSVIYFISCSSKPSVTQRDYLTPETMCGTVQFSDGCSPKLDTLIMFGIALIHHMTYEDAAYTFGKVIESDKDCFWGYWGKAMTLLHPLWPDLPSDEDLNQGFILSQDALRLADTKKEKLYGNAIAAYFKDGVNKTEPERLKAFNEGWELADKELPDDIEAKMFHVLSMLSTVSPDDKTYKIQREAGAVCEEVMKIIPDHPGAFHYAIHAYDYPPLALDAERVARNYYKIAPELPHALHMPTHIFTRLGHWQASIDLNQRSSAAAKKIPVKGMISGQYFHALDYEVYAYLQLSEYKEAKEIADMLDSLSVPVEPVPASAYSLAAVKGRVVLEYQEWEKAANLQLHSGFPWQKFPQYEALIYFARGIGAGRSGDPGSALESYRKLEELQNTFKKTEANKYWITQIEIQKEAVMSWQLFAGGDEENALAWMIKAADLEDATEKNPVTPGSLLPAREMLGDLYMELNRPKDALVQYEQSLTHCKNRYNSLYGAMKSAGMTGSKEKEKYYYTALEKIDKSTGPRRHSDYTVSSRQ
jgi:hypothetical protein